MAISTLFDLLFAFGQQIGILAIAVIGFVATRPDPSAAEHPSRQALAGVIFGGAAILSMLEPIAVTPGVIFDARSAILGVSGLFGGPIAAGVAALAAGLYRLSLGGAGSLPALFSILGVSAAGVVVGLSVRRRGAAPRFRHLLILSAAIAAVSLTSFQFLPADVAQRALRMVAAPLVVANTIGVLVLGAILMEYERRRSLQEELAVALVEREQQAERLRASEANYRLLANNMADTIQRLDASLQCLYVSPSVTEMLGWAPDELVGHSSMMLVHPDEVAALEERLVPLLTGRREAGKSLHRLRHRNGEWIWAEAHYRLARGAPGRPVEIISVIRDVSDRMRLEEQFRQAQSMQAIGQLSGGIAHDFNNILTVILGHAEHLAESAPTEEDRGLAEEIVRSSERAADLVSKLLSFGRRQALRPQLVDLSEVALEMARLLRRVVGSSIDITVATETETTALVDVAFLQSAILNLAINARDAMPTGGAMRIRTGRRLAAEDDADVPAGSHVVFIAVQDNGAGIPREVIDRVFEPFFTTKGPGQASGLGLSMVYGFAKQSGGRVEIDSEVGRGTSVSIILRAADALPTHSRTEMTLQAPAQAGMARQASEGPGQPTPAC